MYLKTVLLVFFVQSVHVFAQSPKCAHLDLLFLIDESQSMLIQNGFENGKTFVTSVVNAFSALPDARFAWVTFNSKVWQQTPFHTAQEFSAIVQATKFDTGSSDYLLGFNAAKSTISEYSATAGADREPVIVFFSDGHPTNRDSLNSVADVSKQIRCDLKTKIIGLGVGEDPNGATTIRMAIGADVGDSCSNAFYQDITSYGSVPSEGVGIVQRLLNCQNF